VERVEADGLALVLIADEHSTPAVSPIGEPAASALETFTVNKRRTKRLSPTADHDGRVQGRSLANLRDL
jgi:hypothetical protein